MELGTSNTGTVKSINALGDVVGELSMRRLSVVEYSAAVLLIGLAVTIGFGSRSPNAQVYVLSLAWAGLIGLLAPRPKAIRRDMPELLAARRNEAGQRIVNHDMASALLTIEGAIMALRSTKGEGAVPAEEQALRVDAIAHAIEGEIGRIRRITTAKPTVERECDVVATVEPLVALHTARGAIVDLVMEPDAVVSIPSDDLARAVLNVLDNCSRYASSAPVTISGFAVGDSYRLTVADEGRGMDPGVVDRAFERGVSSRRDGGLGLFSVRELIESSDGSVFLSSSEHGTEVWFDLPLCPAAATAPAAPAAPVARVVEATRAVRLTRAIEPTFGEPIPIDQEVAA